MFAHLRMEYLLLNVYSTKLLLPNSIKDRSQTLQFHLLMLQLLLEYSAITGNVIVARSNWRRVGASQQRDVPVQLVQSLLHQRQLLAQFLQLRVKRATVNCKLSRVLTRRFRWDTLHRWLVAHHLLL